ncbi:L-fuculokinase [Pseudovibrio sp. Tun.PSC04-5.I4]|nr:L-fuculokinase [Pseudovibrio sp. Tun.PSC04-5.I4]
MSQDLVIVLDCGATNIRAIAVDVEGQIVARASQANITVPDAENSEWHVWPHESIFEQFSNCCRDLMDQVKPEQVKAVTVTTFGVDGALVDKTGTPIYPVISWKCPRTADAQQHMSTYFDPAEVARLSGVGHFSFNTINKMIWFRENKPELLEDAHAWLFISSLFTHMLTGNLTTDATMAGTSQLTDLQGQTFNADILSALGLDESLFPPVVQAGDIVGELLPTPAARFGLPAGIPVVSAGHDTQFAVFGSGAEKNQPVLSSGTWEILMARCESMTSPETDVFDRGFTCEWDAQPNHYNPGIQWLASGVLEWVNAQFYRDLSSAEKYEVMINEASQAPVDCKGVSFDPAFLEGGAIRGLTLHCDRGDIYRAALTALSVRLKDSLKLLETVGNFTATELILVGGGSRNALWNQIKADTLQLPIKILDEAETTVLGAAMFAMAGAKLHASADAAREAFNIHYEIVRPATTPREQG